MIFEKNNVKRLGIFVFYDRDGVVDDYVMYLLTDMLENLDRLVVVVNGKLSSKGRTSLEQLTDDVFVRENIGLDAAAYRQGLCEYCGWEEVQKYDEIVLFNDTFYGPFYPFSEIFCEMNDRDLDLWGLTEHYKTPVSYNFNKNGYMPQHIQSYFVVIRRKLASSYEFRKYWDELPVYGSFEQVVQNHEVLFTQYFADKGFKCGVFINTEDWMELESDNINYYTFAPGTMIQRKKYNILKRKNFVLEQGHHLLQEGGEELQEAMEYIRTYTKYDVSLIWQNLLRLYNVGQLKQTLHLNYVLSADVSTGVAKQSHKIAIFAHLKYQDLFEEDFKFIKKIPQYIDVYVLVNDKADEEFLKPLICDLKNIVVNNIELDKRGNFQLLKECAKKADDYEYICLLHDIKTSGTEGAFSVGASYRYNIWNNMIRCDKYIENIIELLNSNPSLGLLSPPTPIHNRSFQAIGNGWGGYYSGSKNLIKAMGLNCNISQDISPFTSDMVFWCRADALRPLFDWCIDNDINFAGSNEIEHILSYVAQHQGYYSGWVMNHDYASLQISNLQYMLGELVAIGQEGMHSRATCYLEFKELLASGYGMVGLKGAIKIYLKKRLPKWLISITKHTIGKIFRL